MGGPLVPLEGQVEEKADEIRQLKAALCSQGCSSSDVNKNPEVRRLLEELNKLKAQLRDVAPESQLLDEAFFARKKEEQEKALKLKTKQEEEERHQVHEASLRTVFPLVQRKIFHLFKHTGNGNTFHYIGGPPCLNTEQTGFEENPKEDVLLTEKWDGTTMQATCNGIFKRIDLRTGGTRGRGGRSGGRGRGPKGHGAQGEDASTSSGGTARYDLRLLAWRTDNGWHGLDFHNVESTISQGVKPYLDRIAALPEGFCVYFELIHTDINTTFRHLSDLADIRVFDFAERDDAHACGLDALSSAPHNWVGGSFLPFGKVLSLAAAHGLPCVAHRRSKLTASSLWTELVAAKSEGRYHDVDAPLEGYVVRSEHGDHVAKARVEYVPDKVDVIASTVTSAAAAYSRKTATDSETIPGSLPQCAGRLPLKGYALTYLQAIGVMSV